MKTSVYLLGLVAIFILVGFLEAQTIMDNEKKTNHYNFTDETESVNASGEPNLPSSTQYVLEESREEDGEIVEVYGEYEIYEDENGVVVERVPTSNYEFLRYKEEE
ncbi:hypothetical protein GMD78_06120 [Ornithinibacillus sp. L9]|uniref:Uncharacterized protein n=1 Tax=Ornithinibacillus caprae TaxID=2678566 RepID=A0A6N8FEM5_9BACI|nr:hypothetical protein [Ornithinibacillus caprae]MUK87973.1 hypothetical protein [Ornithinibacillus caprae]